jgi:hypothetical protein
MSRPDPILAVLAAAAIFAAAPAVQAAAPAAPAATSPQPAPAWSETFVPATVGTYLGDKKPNVMVVGATAVSAAAAEALRAAMRASKSAGLVMDAQAIGVTEGLDDRTIVERAKSQPVGQIVIVRVFDGGPDEPPSAIVTFYRPDGTVATAITSTAGQAIASNGGATASAGVSSEAVAAVEAVSDDSAKETKEVEKVNAEAQAKYDAKYLWFENWIGVSAQSGAVVATWSQLKQGKYGADVRGKKLYEIVGRDDLVKRYRTRLGIRLGVGIGVSVGGIAMLTAGAFTLIRSADPATPSFGFDDPIGMGRTIPGGLSLNGSLALMGAGTALYLGGMFFAIFFKSHPVSKSEAAELMDTYNKGLRKELGLPEKQARIRMAPSFGQHHAGMAISGRF